MKKAFSLLFIAGLTFGLAGLSVPLADAQQAKSSPQPFFSKSLKPGDRGEEVRNLQTILKSDSSVYPQGMVTGFYGSLTANAVKKLQRKYGLPQTGVLDAKTQEVIFPSQAKMDLTVLSPNGGETWASGEVRTISWRASFEPVVLNGETVVPPTTAAPGVKRPEIAPFFPYISIFLTDDNNSSFRRHIATVNAFEAQYNWRIPSSIPEKNTYRIEIDSGRSVPCILRAQAEGKAETTIFPSPCPDQVFFASDVSDTTFTIQGGSAPDIEKLKEQVRMIEVQLKELMRQIEEIRRILENL